MANLIQYQHIERYGTDEVEGINLGKCHIFPKLDGTNASFWWEENALQCGSRTRVLSESSDNAGFWDWTQKKDNLKNLAQTHPELRFYGEWLVPHTLKTYQDEAWRKLWIFDVYNTITETYLDYDTYSNLLNGFGVDYIPCIATSNNPSYEQLCGWRDRNTFLIKDGGGIGEGIVIKQYLWKNRFGRTTWAKLVTNNFKDQHVKIMGGAVLDNKVLEEDIAREFVTLPMVEKIIAKIRTEEGAFNAKDIPRLLGQSYHDLITEELWEVLKKHKSPTISFKTLNHFTIAQVKQLKPELFGINKGI